MELKKGIPVVPGYSIGNAFVLDSEEYRIPRRQVSGEKEVRDELEKLEEAREQSIRELEEILDKFDRQFGGQSTPIVESHISMLKDDHLLDLIKKAINEEQYTAEYAVSRIFRQYIKQMQASSSEAYSGRIQTDLNDIEKRWLRNLLGERRQDIHSLEDPMIIIARELTPSQTASLDREKVLGFATDAGGRTSHTAIVARDMGIPAVVGLNDISNGVSGGDKVIIDGNRGMVFVNPDQQTLDKYRDLEQNYRDYERRLEEEQKDQPAQTKDNERIKLLGNIQYPAEIEEALRYGAEGIGLYRTEFLYFNPDSNPGEEEHFEAYSKSLRKLNGKPITFRTLDLGADKMAGDQTSSEDNPFLGLRAIRLCIKQSQMFRQQLRAILRAGTEGDARILFPMISSRQELDQALQILDECKRELDQKGIPFDENIPVGVMVEVPSLAMTVDLIADDIDFLSIGTNDLIQYALAVDRTNAEIADLYQPAHPAILQLLRDILETGKTHDLPVSMCGEMSSDIKYVLLLLGMGLKEFSVAPTAILEVKKIIRSVTMEEAEEIAEKAFDISEPEKTNRFLEDRTSQILPEAF